jgi:hypothetical protein
LIARLGGALFFVLSMATQSSSIGIPSGWDRGVYVIETKRPDGHLCPPGVAPAPSPSAGFAIPDYCPGATGFLVHICNLTILVSNRHVLASASETPLFIRTPLKAGGIIRSPLGEWRKHPDPLIDVAAVKPMIPSGYKMDDLDVAIFDEDGARRAGGTLLLRFADLRAGDEMSLLGYPISIPAISHVLAERNTPILRGGIVSATLPGMTVADGKPRWRDVFLVDSWAFQGNSGSPVFSRPTFLRFPDDRPDVDLSKPRIIGVVSEFLNWGAGIVAVPSQTQRVNAAAVTNSGLAVIQSADAIEQVAKEFVGANCDVSTPTPPASPTGGPEFSTATPAP